MYSFPNILLPIFGGLLADRIGNGTCNLLFTFIISAGQALFAFGVSIQSYPIALLGRGVYGLGGECLNVTQLNTLSDWFTKKDRSMAVSVIFMVRRLITAINDNTTPNIEESTSLSFSLWVGFFLCLLSFAVALILKRIDSKKFKHIRSNEKKVQSDDEKFKIADARHFGVSFWLITLYCGIMESAVYAYNSIASDYFQKRFGYSTVEAGRIISITFLMCGLFCPITGVLLDRYGRRIYYVIASAVLLCLAHTLLLLTPDSNKPISPVMYMTLLGLGFSIASTVVWSSISYLVTRGTGTALGIDSAALNTMLVIFPVIVGYINQPTSKDHGYFWVSVIFVCLSGAGLVNSVGLFFANKKEGTLHVGKIKHSEN